MSSSSSSISSLLMNKEEFHDKLFLGSQFNSKQLVNSNSNSAYKLHTNTPILSAILNKTELLPYVLQFNLNEINRIEDTDENKLCKDEELMCYLKHLNKKFKAESEEPSHKYEDYFQIIPEHTKSLEQLGSENSLFLAVARSLLYKIYFVDRKYEFILRNQCFEDHTLKEKFKFDSDLSLQEVLRKRLCSYWLSNVRDGKFINDCKYSKDFTNVFDFIYQVYQISVNNFSNNKLFKMYAIEDLVQILKVKIFVFEMNSVDEDSTTKSFTWTKYEPCVTLPTIKLNDYIFLSMNNNLKIKYKFLMPITSKPQIENTLLSPIKRNFYYFKYHSAYSNYMLVLDSSYLFKCFSSKTLTSNLNIGLFLKFLSESSVHTLMSLNDLKFEPVIRSNNQVQMVNFLNRLWGQNHFDLQEVLGEVKLNKEKKNTIEYGIPQLDAKKTFKQNINENLTKTNLLINNYQRNPNENDCEIKRKRRTSASSLTQTLITNRPLLSQPASLISTFKKTVSVNQITNLFTNKMELRSDDEINKNNSNNNLLKERFDHEQNILNSKRKQSINQEIKVTELSQEFKTRRKTADFFTDAKNIKQKDETKAQILVLPPTLPKSRLKSVATIISDLKQTSFPPKLTSNAIENKDDNEKTPESQSFKSNSDTSSSSGSSTSSQNTNDKARRNKTITQLNTRRSLNSCLNNILSFTSKENNTENSEY